MSDEPKRQSLVTQCLHILSMAECPVTFPTLLTLLEPAHKRAVAAAINICVEKGFVMRWDIPEQPRGIEPVTANGPVSLYPPGVLDAWQITDKGRAFLVAVGVGPDD